MTDEIFFDGRRYISASEAASSSDLTRDYVARLCRDGRGAGRRIGKNWYVDRTSFGDFLVTQQFAKDRRKNDLARERALEYYGADTAPVTPAPLQVQTKSVALRSPAIPANSAYAPALRPVSRIISSRADEIKNKLAAAVATQSSQGGGQAKLLFSAPGGFAHAALTAAHVPVYALSPVTELL